MQQRQAPPDRGARLDWTDLPRRVQGEVERWLGSEIVRAVTQPTGFSPGVAARLTAADGRRVFAKAVGPEPNADAPTFHRREIAIAASPPDAAPSPRLLWSYDEGPSQNRHSREGGNPGVGGGLDDEDRGWVLLLFEDVDGRHPTQPWRLDQLDRVIAAMEDLAGTLTPSPLPASVVGTAGERLLGRRSWRRLRDDHPSRLDSVDKWTRRHLDTLVAIEDSVADALAGDTLLNYDVRADNILLTQGRTWFVDWPHACVGPPWLDVVAFAPSVTMQGGPPRRRSSPGIPHTGPPTRTPSRQRWRSWPASSLSRPRSPRRPACPRCARSRTPRAQSRASGRRGARAWPDRLLSPFSPGGRRLG